ncbi:hypothetical protein [Leucobacter manosquensis]|uniref:MAPEG family protein n=1 Tax=Leucobacter manosquensis TaxID=2810611 RepID=A0ABS5M6K8_9MICO|nr:hypothetical protein [Leucobacter manosquensis]MBS3182830.1 hypothetical protein [Leucobacter manosquensis]
MSENSHRSRSFTTQLATGEGVYGLILVSGLVATASSAGASSFRVLTFVAITVAVFWLAHVYSNVVAGHGRADQDGRPKLLRQSVRESVRETRGMLFATVFPAATLLLGVLGVVQDRTANWLALWVCVGALAALGYRSYQAVGARLGTRIIGALATASFGLIIIAAKAIVTH